MLLTGGGTGGHITPLLAVAHKLKQQSNVHITYVGERGSKFSSMTDGQQVFDAQRQVFAGKFRRYHGESWLKRLFDIQTNLLNLRDVFFVGIGFFESLALLLSVRPDVVLLKGGFVGMPVGLAAALLRIPFVTHDSDAVPGLANRLVAKWARYHATGMPPAFYHYPKESMKYVGVLVSEKYVPVTTSLKRDYRKQLNIPDDAKVLMVTGGSLGAKVVNDAVKSRILELKKAIPDLYVIHQTGQGKEYEIEDSKAWLDVQPLLKDMHRYSGAADVIVTRAGANTLAEFGVQGKACIVVPNPLLTGGHQLVNAKELADNHAVVVVGEEELEDRFSTEVTDLLNDTKRQKELADKLAQLTKHNAAEELAEVLLTVTQEKR